MGYSHYWYSKMPNNSIDKTIMELKPPVWKALQNFAAAVVETFQKQGGDADFENTPHNIWVNGALDINKYEDFNISQGILDFDCCKTAHREYDTVVVAIMVGMAATNAYRLESDGTPDNLRNGCLLALQCLPELQDIISESGILEYDFKTNLHIFGDGLSDLTIFDLADPLPASEARRLKNT